VRGILRDKEFESWSSLPSKGKGVKLFDEEKKLNKWFFEKKRLTDTEWKTTIKMIGNVAPVRGIPGRSKAKYQCRHCSTETETIAHVLGSCPHGSLLRNTRHHTIRSIIAKELQKVGMENREEIHCIRNNGSTARVDVLAWNATSKKGYILDPTVRQKRKNILRNQFDGN